MITLDKKSVCVGHFFILTKLPNMTKPLTNYATFSLHFQQQMPAQQIKKIQLHKFNSCQTINWIAYSARPDWQLKKPL